MADTTIPDYFSGDCFCSYGLIQSHRFDHKINMLKVVRNITQIFNIHRYLYSRPFSLKTDDEKNTL